jgi:hypothetical protein
LPQQAILVSDWLISKKSSSLKPLCQMNQESEINEQSLLRTFQGCFLPNFDSFGQAVTEEKIL